MIEQDMHEASNKTIDYIEYLATFSNPSGVEKMRKMRESVQNAPVEDPELFANVLSKQFGKELSKEELVHG